MTPVAPAQQDLSHAVIRRFSDAGRIAPALGACHALLRARPCDIAVRLLAAELHLSLAQPDQALEQLDAAAWYIQQTDNVEPQYAIDQLLLRGKALRQQSRAEDACLVWRQILTIHPRHPQALELLAGACEQLGRLDQAIAYLEHLLLTDQPNTSFPGGLNQPSHIDHLRQLADLCERDGQHARALALLERYGLADHPRMQWQMVRLLRHADRKQEAMDRLAELCRMFPDDLTLAMTAAQLAGELGHEATMLNHARRAMRDPAASHGALLAIATHAQRIGRIAHAGRLWYRLARRSAEYAPRAFAHAAACAAVMGRDRLADRLYARLKKLAKPADRHALLSTAWLELVPGRLLLDQLNAASSTGLNRTAEQADQSVLAMLLTESAETLEHQAEHKPDYADVHHHLAVCQQALGHTDSAAVNSERALLINAGYTHAAMLRARMLIDEGAAEAALAVLNAALSRKPGHLEMSALAGALEVMSSRWKDALARLTADEHRPQLRQRIAQWLEQLGRDSEAIQWRNAA